MKSSLRLLAGLVLFPLAWVRAEGLPSLENSRALYRDAAGLEASRRGEARASLHSTYVADLDLLAQQAQQAGHLDILLRVRGEQEKARAGTLDATPDPAASPPLLAARSRLDLGLQAVDAESAARLGRLRATYLNHLAQLQRQLTIDNRIEEALAVRSEIQALQAEIPATANTPPPGHGKPSLVWRSGKADQGATLSDGASRRDFAILHKGGNRITAEGWECLGGQSILPAAATEALVAAIQASGELTFVLGFTPGANAGENFFRIVTFGKNEQDMNLAASQRFGNLYVRMRSGDIQSGIRLGQIAKGKSSRIAVTLKDGKVRYYRDGKDLDTEPVVGAYTIWKPMEMVVGNDVDGGRPWHGVIHHLEILAHALEPDAARAITQTP